MRLDTRPAVLAWWCQCLGTCHLVGLSSIPKTLHLMHLTRCILDIASYALHHTHYILHYAPCTLLLTYCIIHIASYTLQHTAFYNLQLTHCTLQGASYTLHKSLFQKSLKIFSRDLSNQKLKNLSK